MNTTIRAIEHNREQFLDLLLLADPSEKMVKQYIASGHLFALFENGEVYGVIHLVPQTNDIMEIKNVAVKEDIQGRGYGKKLVQYALKFCQQQQYQKVVVGTGNSSINNLAFYQKAGFRFLSVLRDYFTDHYQEPIFENRIQCRDMIILEADLAIISSSIPIVGLINGTPTIGMDTVSIRDIPMNQAPPTTDHLLRARCVPRQSYAKWLHVPGPDSRVFL